MTAVLVLEDGRCWRGEGYGAPGVTFGEAVFATGMTGYQETLTDPSYHRQIVVMTAPHIGNTGVNDEDGESSRIWVAGYVVRDAARRASSWRSRRELADELAAAGVVGISGVDTRSVTRYLRERGAMRAGIFSGEAAGRPEAELVAQVRGSAPMAGADLATEVSTPAAYTVGAAAAVAPTGAAPTGAAPTGAAPTGAGLTGVGLTGAGLTVAAVDLGIKTMTPAQLARRGVDVRVLPATSGIEDILAAAPDGVFFSNGPGDPAAMAAQVALLREVLARRLPFFGICFGNQLFGRALGFDTYKLRYGHRGINQPVMDRTTGRVEVTAHNHGFAVDAPLGEVTDTPFGRAEVSHVNLNDDVVEGLHLLDAPAFSVQYHPEAAAGPHDASYLFDRFVDLMASQKASD